MTSKGIIFMALIILTLFVSTVKAADDCTAGASADKKAFTLYINNNVFHLIGDICIFDKDTAEWKAKDTKNNNIYFSGTYAIRSGHHDMAIVNQPETSGNPANRAAERILW